MSWITRTITVPAATTVAAPVEQALELINGRVRAVVVSLEPTTSALQGGIRISTPRGLLFPVRAVGSDDWLYSHTFGYERVLADLHDLEEVSPVHLTVQGINSDSASFVAQVMVYVEPWHTEVERALHGIRVTVEAMRQAAAMPDLELQVRRLLTLLLGGGNNGTD